MALGASKTVSSDPFGGLLEPLGASWWCLGELLGAPLGILGAFLGGKASKMPSRTPKTSPRPPLGPRDPQDASKLLFHKPQRVPEKLSKEPRSKREDNVN